MTTDASRNNAEQWHIPPQSEQLNNKRDPKWDLIGDHGALLPKQPTVIATHVVDLTPVVAFFREELQRLRDQLAVERTAASSAREALAACEQRLEHARCDAKDAQQMLMDERAKSSKPSQPDPTRLPYPGDAARTARELGKLEVRYAQRCDRNAQLRVANMELRKERDALRAQLQQAKMAAEEGMREHDRMRRELEQAKTVPPGLVPGSVAAILEAYRLITGVEPKLGSEWTGQRTNDGYRDQAGSELLNWLDENVPRRGRP